MVHLAEVPPKGADRKAAFSALRVALGGRHYEAAQNAFVPLDERLIPTGLGELDRVLDGGFPRGLIATLEGTGAGTLAARLFARTTPLGLGALIERPAWGCIAPRTLVSAGVNLDRLLVVHAQGERDIARSTDILLRSGAFGLVTLPAVALRATEWTRLAGLAHRHDVLLVALGPATHELRYFASVRVGLQVAGIRWLGGTGLFGTLAGIEIEATVLKHKRAAPGRSARFTSTTFEREQAPIFATRECTRTQRNSDADRLRVRSIV
ncbi:MAG TPA: hypothetical protein VKG44_11095 [Candidatus Baltobacteraceae bacterium]|nr:hypothetical protein [Candidatus Baltobacteraceae bacterium]